MRLNKKDIEILKSWGCTERDIIQIEEATKFTTYECNDEKIGVRKVIEILGREDWLSGMHRSAFHCDACRKADGFSIYFDSYKYFFKDYRKSKYYKYY